MTQEALKLALEALENSVDLVVEDAYNAEQLYGKYPTRQKKVNGLKILAEQHKQAITAIKEALAQPEQDADRFCDANCVWTDHHPDCKLAQPEQEPVAWNVVGPTGKIVATEMNSVRGWARIEGYKPTVEGLLGFHERGWRVVPTTPPQRTWVGLTVEEIEEVGKPYEEKDRSIRAWGLYAVAIEAKLKEKNT